MRTNSIPRLQTWLSHLGPRTLILVYHRVNDSALDPQLLCVRPEHFAEQLEVLCRLARPVPLRDAGRRSGVAITFDDGYADNLYQALPLLEARDVPVTVFVTAGMADAGHEFWWDEIERVLLTTPVLPKQLQLIINGAVHHWDLAAEADTPVSLTSWHVLAGGEVRGRRRVYLELTRLLKILPLDEREQVLTGLFAWAGVSRVARPTHRILTAKEVRQLDGQIVEVGAHTLTHPTLSAIPLATQSQEVLASKQLLEECLQHPVSSFAYPFGGRGDYTASTIRLVRAAGFVRACSNFPGRAGWATDRFQLPRVLVRDWDGDEFARRLEAWLGR